MDHSFRNTVLHSAGRSAQLLLVPGTGLTSRLKLLTPFAVVLGAVLTLGGCGDDDGPGNDGPAPMPMPTEVSRVVTEAEARQLLAETVSAVKAGKASEVCESGSMSRGLCADPQIIRLAPVNQPEPAVLDSREVLDSACGADGRLLVITGLDASGASFTSEFHVSRDSAGVLTARFPLYWFDGSGIDEPGNCN